VLNFQQVGKLSRSWLTAASARAYVVRCARAADIADAAEDVAVEGAIANVEFKRAGTRGELGQLTVLEAAEECGVAIPFECRSGICGQCKTKLVAGKVRTEVKGALTSGDVASGLILACQARATRDIVVDA